MPVQKIKAHNPLEGPRPELSIPLHDATSEQISIIIVHRNRPEYLNILLQSIAVTSYNSNYEIVIVDNDSDDESQQYLNEIEGHGEIKIVRNNKNEYWSAACNKGVQKADKGSKYFIFLHADVVILDPAWMDTLINVSDSKKSGFVGVQTTKYKLGNGEPIEFIQEFLLLITRECWNDIGPWPEELPMIAHAFIMNVRASSMGHNPQFVRNTLCHHYKIGSLNANEQEKMVEQARALLPKMISNVNSKSVKPQV